MVLHYIATLLLMRMCSPSEDKAKAEREEESAVEKVPISQSFSNGKLAMMKEPEEGMELLNKEGEAIPTLRAETGEDAHAYKDGAATAEEDAASGAPSDGDHASTLKTTSVGVLIGQSLHRILDTLQAMENVLTSLSRRNITVASTGPKQTEEQIKWKAVGAVMDRFFMVGYIVIICISLTFLLPRAHSL